MADPRFNLKPVPFELLRYRWKLVENAIQEPQCFLVKGSRVLMQLVMFIEPPRLDREHIGGPGLELGRRLLRDIDVVIVWRLDRWGRPMADLVTTLQELRDLDVGFVSLTEALDLTTPSGRRNDLRNFVGITLRRMFFVLLRKAARILAAVPRPPACFFHAETLL